MEELKSTTAKISGKIFDNSEIKQKQTEIEEPEKNSNFLFETPQITQAKVTTSFGTPIEEIETKKEELMLKRPFFKFSSSTLVQTSFFKFGLDADKTSSSVTTRLSTYKQLKKKIYKRKKKKLQQQTKQRSFHTSLTFGTDGFSPSNLNKENKDRKEDEIAKKLKEAQTSLFERYTSKSIPTSFSSTTPSLTPSQPIYGFDSNRWLNIFTSRPWTFGLLNSNLNEENFETRDDVDDFKAYEYEPPKPKKSNVKEDGTVYEKRIKLYYFSKIEKKYKERGIGNLFIKPIKNGNFTQLVIRADTELANILLNVELSKLLPIVKTDLKNILFASISNPAIPGVSETIPCIFLFQVKTEDEANELFDKLNEHKK